MSNHAIKRFLDSRAVTDWVSSKDIRDASNTHEGIATDTNRDPDTAWSDAWTGRIAEIKFKQLTDIDVRRFPGSESDYIKELTGKLIDVKAKSPRSDLSKVYVSTCGRPTSKLSDYYVFAVYYGKKEKIKFIGYLTAEDVMEHGERQWMDGQEVMIIPLVRVREFNSVLGLA